MSYPPRRAIQTVPGVAQLRTGRGPALIEYVYVLDLGKVFRWSPGSTETDDGSDFPTVITCADGFPGAYLLVRADDRGDDLTAEAAQTLTIADGGWRVIPVSTLTENIVLTLSIEGVIAGDQLEITRLDTGVFTAAVLNGGPGGGPLTTFPVSSRAFMLAQAVTVAGLTDWAIRDSHTMI